MSLKSPRVAKAISEAVKSETPLRAEDEELLRDLYTELIEKKNWKADLLQLADELRAEMTLESDDTNHLAKKVKDLEKKNNLNLKKSDKANCNVIVTCESKTFTS